MHGLCPGERRESRPVPSGSQTKPLGRGAMYIKNPASARLRLSRPTAKDRQALDFARFLQSSTAEGGPAPGVSFARLLGIAAECCGRPIGELTEIKTRAEFRRIEAKLRKEKNAKSN